MIKVQRGCAILFFGLLSCSISAASPAPASKLAIPENSSSVLPKEGGERVPDAASDTTVEEGIQSIIQCFPKDGTVVFDFNDQTISIKGDGGLEYGDTKVEAEDVIFNWGERVVTIMGKRGDGGVMLKEAVLNQGEAKYSASTIRYHLDSRRAIAAGLVTKQGDGFLRAEKIKKSDEGIFYGNKSAYTTCDHVHPHFHIASEQFKLVQGKKIVSGPFWLCFDGVPTPIGLPFGLFYLPQESGIIAPFYAGFDSQKGFGLINGGYYVRFSDYAGLKILGGIYSRLTTNLDAKFMYKKRYSYSGNVFYKGNWDRHTESARSHWQLGWKHSTEHNKVSSFHADVLLENGSFSKVGGASVQAQKDNYSSIHYANDLVGLPYVLDIKASYQSSSSSGNARKQESLTFPDAYIETDKLYPLRQSGGDSWYSDIYLTHRLEAIGRFSNRSEADGSSNEKHSPARTFLSPGDWEALLNTSRYGMCNYVPIRADMKLFRYFSLTPSFNYTARWYAGRYDYNKSNKERGYKRGFNWVGSYDWGGSLETFLYGTYTVPFSSFLQSLRHEIHPQISLTYTPDFSDLSYGYYQKVGEDKQYCFDDTIYSAPSSYKELCLDMRLGNKLLAKIVNMGPGKSEAKKFVLLKSFDWRARYDFLKKEHPLSDISMRVDGDLFGDLASVSFNAYFDPYWQEKVGEKLEKRTDFAWQHGQGWPYIGNLDTANLRIDTKLGPLGNSALLSRYKTADDAEKSQDDTKDSAKKSQRMSKKYVAFDIPWGVTMGYSLGYSRLDRNKAMRQYLDFKGTFRAGEYWKVVVSGDYNITDNKMNYDGLTFDVTRDLHCWDMKFECRPWGSREYYAFKIGVKAPSLKFLRYSRRR